MAPWGGERGNWRWHNLRRAWDGLELGFCLACDRVDHGLGLGHDLGVGRRAEDPSPIDLGLHHQTLERFRVGGGSGLG